MYNQNTLKVTLVQQNIIWEDKKKNLLHLDELLSKVNNGDLIILPELFPSGFSMNVESLAEKLNGDTISWMKEKAKTINCFLLGSLIFNEHQKFYNRLFVFTPNGEFIVYDKRHLFAMGEEDKFYTGGRNRLIFRIKDWRVSPLICYDLRFPVWSRNKNDYDLLIYVANWPASRKNIWSNLLVARAIENQSYVIGVNRIGFDGNGVEYSGGSCVLDAKGNTVFQAPENEETVNTIKLNLKSLIDFRKEFPVLNDRDNFYFDLN